MKKIMIVLVMVFLLIGIASAVQVSYSESSETNSPADNWLGRVISQIKFSIFNEGTFTIYGRELKCSETADDIITFKKGILPVLSQATITAEPGEAMFVNWFRGSPNDGTYSEHPEDPRQFMREDYLERGEISYGWNYKSSFTCDAGSYWNNECYGEYYICPLPCYSDSECGSGKFCDKSILSQKITNAGVCKSTEIPTYKTKVYKCENGVKTLLKSVSSGNLNYCDENENNYLIPGSEASGVCYLESEEPLICSEIPEVVDNQIGNNQIGNNQIGTAPPESIDKEGIFYTNGYAIIGKGNFKFLGYSSQSTSGSAGLINTKDLEGVIPGLSAKYFENKADACAEGLEPQFVEEKEFSYSKVEFNLLGVLNFLPTTINEIKSWFGVEKMDDITNIAVTYSVYKCIPEGEAGFCLETAHRLLGPLTKSDDCQQNTIMFAALIAVLLILLLSITGGKK